MRAKDRGPFFMDFFEEIINQILTGKIKDKNQLQIAKKEIAVKYGMSTFPTDADILARAGDSREKVVDVLQKKPSRTLSGVAVVAVMTPPSACPHGKCLYCMGGPDARTPQSYTGEEPAAQRGRQYEYNPFAQITNRIRQLEMIGHNAEKIELIVMGGTFTAQPDEFQYNFIKGCFDGMNGVESPTFESAMMKNETAKHRCVGLTIETRPDFCKKPNINKMLAYGATRVELGVQHPDNEIYELNKRGHTVEDVAAATQLAKDAGLKINYHLMPNLPGSTIAKDRHIFKKIFEDEGFRPDMIKLYPCLLTDPKFGQIELARMYKNGGWKPYSEKKLAELLVEVKSELPSWVRVMRIQRDVPANLIVAGVRYGNLRQILKEEMRRAGKKCKCIRCREIRDAEPENVKMNVEKYKASGGEEFFISLDDKDKLVGFLRLRQPGTVFRPELENAALVRELHIYGRSLPLGEKDEGAAQHHGFGTDLLAEAERTAAAAGAKKIAVTSGVGVREYYRKFGYELIGPYMIKQL